MALIVLIAICFLPCCFYLYVLMNWARDTRRQKTFSGSNRQAVITTRTTRLVAKPSGLAPKGERCIYGSGIGWCALERNVYGTIAASLLDNQVPPKTPMQPMGMAPAPPLQAMAHRDRRRA